MTNCGALHDIGRLTLGNMSTLQHLHNIITRKLQTVHHILQKRTTNNMKEGEYQSAEGGRKFEIV